ncbi:hypothetical protein Tco_1495927, partial [Tanacetum coccineum]
MNECNGRVYMPHVPYSQRKPLQSDVGVVQDESSSVVGSDESDVAVRVDLSNSPCSWRFRSSSSNSRYLIHKYSEEDSFLCVKNGVATIANLLSNALTRLGSPAIEVSERAPDDDP